MNEDGRTHNGGLRPDRASQAEELAFRYAKVRSVSERARTIGADVMHRLEYGQPWEARDAITQFDRLVESIDEADLVRLAQSTAERTGGTQITRFVRLGLSFPGGAVRRG